MKIVTNTKELPRDPLRCFSLTEEEARAKATEYQSAWFYPQSDDRGYLYVLNSEYEAKQRTK